MLPLLLNLLILLYVYCFDPSIIPYCDLKCSTRDGVFENSACSCKKNGTRQEETVNIDRFRLLMLKRHNMYRERIATGGEKEKGYPPAGNMRVLNYDMELEHLARCFLVSKFVKGNDKCRRASYCQEQQGAGQNIWGTNNLHLKYEKAAEMAVDQWYLELDNIQKDKRDTILTGFDNNYRMKGKVIRHFTQMVWARASKIGCARMKNPRNRRTMSYVIICNYAGAKFCPGNTEGHHVYVPGEPCSQCGNAMCNNETSRPEYQGLCGELNEIAKYTPLAIEEMKENGDKNDNKQRDRKRENTFSSKSDKWNVCFFLFLLSVAFSLPKLPLKLCIVPSA